MQLAVCNDSPQQQWMMWSSTIRMLHNVALCLTVNTQISPYVYLKPCPATAQEFPAARWFFSPDVVGQYLLGGADSSGGYLFVEGGVFADRSNIIAIPNANLYHSIHWYTRFSSFPGRPAQWCTGISCTAYSGMPTFTDAGGTTYCCPSAGRPYYSGTTFTQCSFSSQTCLDVTPTKSSLCAPWPSGGANTCVYVGGEVAPNSCCYGTSSSSSGDSGASSSTGDDTSSSSGSSNTLSTLATVGIAVGVSVAVLLGAVATLTWYCHHRRSSRPCTASFQKVQPMPYQSPCRTCQWG